MLWAWRGDGHLAHTQVTVTLGNKEQSYSDYVATLIKKIFGPLPKISITKRGYTTIYLGSVDIVNWLKSEGLVFNKVKVQVDIPRWIFTEESYMRKFLQGFAVWNPNLFYKCVLSHA